jgi:hypothetical protein
MCFSAEASFAASGVLAASSIAIARIPKAKAQIPLSLFPPIFSVHQFIEGILWLNHDGVISGGYNPIAVYGFVLIAFVLWPLYVPWAAYVIETGTIRRGTILLCLGIGIYVSIVLFSSIIRNPLEISVVGHSFSYRVTDIPDNLFSLYFVSVSIPFIVLRSRKLMAFGLALMVSSAIAAIVASSTTYPSVWCFFAALLSLGIYLYFHYQARVETTGSVVSTDHRYSHHS